MRFTIALRTIDIADVQAGKGAPDRDPAAAGTSLRDFRRVSDRGRMPRKIALAVDPRRNPFKQAVFQPPVSLLAELAAKNAGRAARRGAPPPGARLRPEAGQRMTRRCPD